MRLLNKKQYFHRMNVFVVIIIIQNDGGHERQKKKNCGLRSHNKSKRDGTF
jgi:hypothetical protein